MSKGNKERILETARRLFGELGYADTTYKRIAQETGIADGLIATTPALLPKILEALEHAKG